ncbi:MAG: carboxypeptidase-like regulatory domain-containing protein [Chitinophagaceae bacterium]|nr:carboxypeptidase-like regulatory domain-containing protein [Chitinophagaceae bacterium]
MLRALYSLLLLTVFALTAAGQPARRTISGLVTSEEDGTPLEGVQILAKGSRATSGTQQDGMYYIQVTGEDSVLVFSREGFAVREVRLTAATDYNIQLRQGGLRQDPIGTFSPIGTWRAVFQMRSGIEVPVVFDIHADKDGVTRAYFHNAEERFDGGRVEQTGDSLFIFLDQFDNELAFHIDGTVLTGVLRRQDKTGSYLPVRAMAGVAYRFKETGIKPVGDITGTYDISFTSENGKEEKAVGVFRQDGNQLRGTFLRVTGDARYLEGIVEGDHFFLYRGGPCLLQRQHWH